MMFRQPARVIKAGGTDNHSVPITAGQGQAATLVIAVVDCELTGSSTPPALTYLRLQSPPRSVSNTLIKHEARAAHRKWRGHRAGPKTTRTQGK